MKSKENQSIETRVSDVFSMFGKPTTAINMFDVEKQFTKLKLDLNGIERSLALSQFFVAVVNFLNGEGISLEEATQKGLGWIEQNKHLYKANGRKKRIGIIPGSFDPITYAHLQMGKKALASGLVDEVLYMVANNHAEKINQTPALKRLEMVQLALQDKPNMSASPFEIELDLGGQTHFMTRKLLEDPLFQDKEVKLVFGADVVNTYKNWPDAELQVKLISCIVFPRKNHKLMFNSWYNKPYHHLLEKVKIAGISSTQVRDATAANKDVSKLILPVVEEFIRENNLYNKKK